MSHSTGPPNWWQKLDEQMNQDSKRTVGILGRIYGLRDSSSVALPESQRSQASYRKARPRNRRRRKRRIVIIEESTERIAPDGVSHSTPRNDSAQVANRPSEWPKWICLMALFVIWPELLGYLYVGLLLWVCFRTLFHHYAALDRLQRH